jgi:hypothetical protein
MAAEHLSSIALDKDDLTVPSTMSLANKVFRFLNNRRIRLSQRKKKALDQLSNSLRNPLFHTGNTTLPVMSQFETNNFLRSLTICLLMVLLGYAGELMFLVNGQYRTATAKEWLGSDIDEAD